jgi:nicotinamidase-related amidase
VSASPSVRVAPDPGACALLLVDLQIGAIGSIRTIEPERLRDNAVALATLANLHRMPAVLTAGRKPGVGGAFLPELRALLPDGRFVERSRAAAFDEPRVRDEIAALERKTLIVAGVATDIGVLFAALGGINAGYEVWVVIDACGAVESIAQEAAKSRMAREGVVMTGWASLAVGLMGDFEGPLGVATMALVTSRMSSASGAF